MKTLARVRDMWRQFWLMRFLVGYRSRLSTPKLIDQFTRIGVLKDTFVAIVRRHKHGLPPVWFWLHKDIRKYYEYLKYTLSGIQRPSRDEVLTQKYKRMGAIHRTSLEDCINDCIENGYIETLVVVSQNEPHNEEIYLKPTRDGREYAKWTGFINRTLEKRSHLVALLSGGTIVSALIYITKILGFHF